MTPESAMTAQDMRFLTAIRNEFGEGPFTSRELFDRLSPADQPTHVQTGTGDPSRMFGRWLAARVGWRFRGLTLQKLARVNNAQTWKFGVRPDEIPPGRVMALEPNGRWYWQELGLWPDEVVK